MTPSRYIILVLCIATMLYSGCSATKRLCPGERLYNGAIVKFANPESVNDDKKVKSELAANSVPEPNAKVFGMRLKLWINQRIKEPKKEGKGLRHILKYRLGEEPVFYDESNSKRSVLLMEKYLEDNGYFRADVQYDTLMKKNGKVVDVVYTVTTEGQYFIQNIILPRDTDEVSRIISKSYYNMIVRSKQPYSMDKLKAERDKFADQIRSVGFYDFNREYIYYYVDTTRGEHKLDLYFRVKQPSDSTFHTKYYIRNVLAYPVYSLDDTTSAMYKDTIVEDSITIIQSEVFLRSKPLVRFNLVRPGKLFSQKNHTYTVNHFLDLGIFKFVNIKYIKTDTDSLDAVLYLTPSETQDVGAEVTVSTTTGNFLGTGASLSYTNRNIFKGGEMLTLVGSANVETQLGNGQSFINTLEVIGRAELAFPKFLVPFSMRRFSLYYVPRTKFGLTETFQKRVEYYTLNSFVFDFAYDWRQNQKVRHILTPLSINSIRLIQTTSSFDDILRRNPTLRSSFDDIFIVSIMYSYIYSGMLIKPEKSYGYFRGNVDLAGNIIYPLALAVSSKTQDIELIGRKFAQYSKFDIDGRYYWKFSKNHSYVNRVIAGIAIPYGNSSVTPYLKQFWIGGSTSVRAYRLRTLGPGSYVNPNADDDNVFPDQTGDIKLEFNSEYRFTIVSFLKGAFFVDAGNVWTLRADTTRPGANFEINRFYKEIAVGGGFGIRLDFNFFVIRADLAIPFRKPELPDGDRWTFDKMDFRNKEWRKDNMIYNIAIGYPF